MTFRFDGEPVPFAPGQTIVAALLASGRRPRMFCGIGACFDCLVVVDDRTVRACLTVPADGDEVRSL